MKPSVEITLEYKLFGQSEWKHLPISPKRYFDQAYVDDDINFDIDDVPLYDHAVEYLDAGIPPVESTRITIFDHSKDSKIIVTEIFWNAGKNRVIERSDSVRGEICYWELITNTRITAQTEEIMRVGKRNGNLAIFSHVFIAENVDGSQTVSKVYPEE